MMEKLPDDYFKVLDSIKAEIRQGRLKAVMGANAQMLSLYWQIGKTLLDQLEQANWGDKLTQRLSDDLRREFPEMKGFSTRNIKYMRQFAATYPDFSIGHIM
jgi:Tfp pilus assembly protein PilF